MDDSQVASGYSNESLKEMRAQLRAAIDLAPGFPDSYYLLAFVNLVNGEQLDDCIVLLKRALSLSPGREEFTFALAQVYLRRWDIDSARAVAETLLRTYSDAYLRARAQSLLQSIASLEEKLARLKAQTPGFKPGLEDESEVITGPPPSLESALRGLHKGEERVRGQLNRVDCVADGVVFSVTAADGLQQLHARRLEDVRFISYTPEVKGEVTCGARNPANAVVVTYRLAKNLRKAGPHEVVAIEFVPADFELTQ
jgi:tetratricopeptide (TPR) repeat protein